MAKIKSTWKWRGKDVPVSILSGEPYMEVATKIALAHEDGGYTEVSHEFLTVGGKDVVRICIEVKGQRFYGSAQIKWGGKNADATDPVENAETSAKGRALSGAGYQINSVASAEDMQDIERVRVVESNPQALPAPDIARECAELGHQLNMDGAAYRGIVQSYKTNGKVLWANVRSALETMLAERSLPAGA
jgi:hypothetical protein